MYCTYRSSGGGGGGGKVYFTIYCTYRPSGGEGVYFTMYCTYRPSGGEGVGGRILQCIVPTGLCNNVYLLTFSQNDNTFIYTFFRESYWEGGILPKIGQFGSTLISLYNPEVLNTVVFGVNMTHAHLRLDEVGAKKLQMLYVQGRTNCHLHILLQ